MIKIDRNTSFALKRANELQSFYENNDDFDIFLAQAIELELIHDTDLYLLFFNEKFSKEEIIKLLEIKFDWVLGKNNHINTEVSKSTSKIRKFPSISELKYSVVSDEDNISEADFNYLEDWMKVSMIIGQFLASKKYINIYFSFIDSLFPSFFIGLSYINYTLKNMGEIDIESIIKKLEIGKLVSVRTPNSDVWTSKKYIGITIHDKDKKYVKLGIPKEGVVDLLEKPIVDNLYKDVRINGLSKRKGNSYNLNLNDYISDFIMETYGEKVVGEMKLLNEKFINYIGRGMRDEYDSIIDTLIFQTQDLRKFTLNDFYYFDDEPYNYSNVNIIRSDEAEKDTNPNILSLFFGDNSAYNFERFCGNKNVYLNNISKGYPDQHEHILTKIKTEYDKDRVDMLSEELNNLLEKNKLQIPKGMEIYVW